MEKIRIKIFDFSFDIFQNLHLKIELLVEKMQILSEKKFEMKKLNFENVKI